MVDSWDTIIFLYLRRHLDMSPSVRPQETVSGWIALAILSCIYKISVNTQTAYCLYFRLSYLSYSLRGGSFVLSLHFKTTLLLSCKPRVTVTKYIVYNC